MNFRNTFTAAVSAALLFVTACSQSGSYDNPQADLSTDLDSVSYALGLQNGKFLSQQGFEEFDIENFSAGIKKGLEGDEDSLNILTDAEANQVIQSYMMELSNKLNEANIEEGVSFLEENSTKEGVQETESGLQYKVIEEGTGDSPEATDQVRVNYEGKLVNGEIFDSSYKNGQPVEFPLNRVIPGWTEGLQLMKEGAKYEFYIPSELGYGNRPPQGSIIEPGSVLIFEVELLEVLDSASN